MPSVELGSIQSPEKQSINVWISKLMWCKSQKRCRVEIDGKYSIKLYAIN